MYDIGWGHVLDYIGVEWENACGGADEDRRGINEYRDFKRTDAGNGEEAGKHGLLSGTEGVL